MPDLNDPQLLGEAILADVKAGMKPTTAADLIYEDQRQNGWRYGYPALVAEPARPALRQGIRPVVPPSPENGTQAGA